MLCHYGTGLVSFLPMMLVFPIVPVRDGAVCPVGRAAGWLP
jgi:hypothetical protein